MEKEWNHRIMKFAYIEGSFPELPGGQMYKNARGFGSTPKVAISRGIAALLKQTKHKRITTLKLTIVISDGCDPNAAEAQCLVPKK
jgi:hypothetical protein